ncbi:MAG: hypothetical protein ACPK85_02675 [Methanosarcina sp.]
MVKRENIGKWLIFLLFICFLSSVSANASNIKFNASEYHEISDPYVKELADDSLFIAYKGTLPESINQNWKNSINNCWLKLTRMGPSYSEFDSSITGVATNGRFLIIELGPAYQAEVNDSRIDETYKKIDDYCKQQEGISHIPVVFMWGENISLPDYGPQVFKEAKKQPGFITTRGTMPVITDDARKKEWTDLLVDCSQPLSRPGSTEGINPYFAEFGGPVIAFGTDINGYIIISFEEYTPEKVNESVINEIYQIIDGHFKQNGITDVPVVFEFSHITEDLAPDDGLNWDDDMICMINEDGKVISVHKNETYIDKDGNYVIMSNNTTQKHEKANQMPGFTLIIGILGFLSFLFIKRS